MWFICVSMTHFFVYKGHFNCCFFLNVIKVTELLVQPKWTLQSGDFVSPFRPVVVTLMSSIKLLQKVKFRWHYCSFYIILAEDGHSSITFLICKYNKGWRTFIPREFCYDLCGLNRCMDKYISIITVQIVDQLGAYIHEAFTGGCEVTIGLF